MLRSVIGLLVVACAQKPPPVLRPMAPDAMRAPAPVGPVKVKGTWTGTLQSPSGPVVLQVDVARTEVPVLILQGQRFSGSGERAGNQVRWTFAALGAVIRGTTHDDRIRGSFEQGGRSVPVELVRSRLKATVRAPGPG